MINSIKKSIKHFFPGVAWQHPILNGAFRIIDPFDHAIRKISKLPEMPSYSVRIRSNGVTGQFGGQRFLKLGNLIASLLKDTANLKPDDKVLEIGCGCGRTAIALSSYLEDAGYTGIDIEKKSLNACKKNSSLIQKGFQFQDLDVYNAEYNPTGKYKGNEYKLPFNDSEFNCVFLISVFTHMMPEDVENYIKEISRVLTDDGVCLISTFLMDRGTDGQDMSFPYQSGDYYTNNLEMPEVAIGFDLEFYERIAAQCGMAIKDAPIYGTWFESTDLQKNRFSQDIIILKKMA